MISTAIETAGLDGRIVNLSADQLDALISRLNGRLLRPHDEGWEDAIRIWNGMAARAPAAVVQPTSTAGVATAVEFARDHGLLLGIKGGGHNISGTAIAPGGLTLDMSRMREVVIDADARLANVGPGCRLGDVDRETQQHGLATPLGFVSKTGVAGLTLGGGLGYLTRRFGWTADNLEEVEIVTADGEIRIANRHEHEDLFWAIRGGGGNFGAVTRFTFRLHEVGPTVFGGLIAWPFDRNEEILRGYRALTSVAPRELAVWLVLMRAPPAPFIPTRWHGRRICTMVVCYSGDLSAVDRAIAPIRRLGEPIVDLLRPIPYVELQSFLDDTEPNGMHYYWRTEFAAELGDDLLEAANELFSVCPVPGAQLGFLHLGGALNDHGPDDGAVGNRDVRYAVGANGMWAPDEPDADAFRAWIREAGNRLRPLTSARSYINFQTSDEGEDRIRATYGGRYDRLVEIKARYDPENLFRVNRNIPPPS